MLNMSTISDIYDIKSVIGKGSYGTVYLVYDKKQKKEIACKIEENSDGKLKYEYKLYKYLIENKMEYIPEIYDYIKTEKESILSMQLMGNSLDKIFIKNKKKMDISTVFKIAINCIDILKQLHNCGIIHRDIKPHNFVINKQKPDQLCIIDFGLAKKYFDPNRSHMQFKSDKDITGTLKYVSMNVHMGIEPSRRDDLESIGYMLVYLAKGILPWQNSQKEITADEIGVIKLYTSSGSLCKDMPKCFEEYLEYCKNLKFTDVPEYDWLIKLFTDGAQEMNITPKFFWEHKKLII
jgi:serine/threonine protein kinase